MTSKSELQAKITRYLQEVDPQKSYWGAAIHAAIPFPSNFNLLVKEVCEAYEHNKEGMIRVIGAVPMLLILKYSKLCKTTPITASTLPQLN